MQNSLKIATQLLRQISPIMKSPTNKTSISQAFACITLFLSQKMENLSALLSETADG